MRIEKFFCREFGCKGHFSPNEKCFPKLTFCGELGCPGHLRASERCLRPLDITPLDPLDLKFDKW
jgi:hypothetical protein